MPWRPPLSAGSFDRWFHRNRGPFRLFQPAPGIALALPCLLQSLRPYRNQRLHLRADSHARSGRPLRSLSDRMALFALRGHAARFRKTTRGGGPGGPALYWRPIGIFGLLGPAQRKCGRFPRSRAEAAEKGARNGRFWAFARLEGGARLESACYRLPIWAFCPNRFRRGRMPSSRPAERGLMRILVQASPSIRLPATRPWRQLCGPSESGTGKRPGRRPGYS